MNGISRSSVPVVNPDRMLQSVPAIAAKPVTESEITTHDIDCFPKKPVSLTFEIAQYLPSSEIPLLAQTNRNNHVAIREYYRARLKPEFQTDKNSSALFENPANRRDRFIPVDEAGKKYLQGLGIPGPETYRQNQRGASHCSTGQEKYGDPQ